MRKPGDNLNVVLSVMAAMSRTGGAEELASVLDEGVVWQGLLPELVCNGRGQVLSRFGRAPLPHITRVEAEEVGERVVLVVRGADFPLAPVGSELEVPSDVRSFVFTFDDGKVVRMESFPSREAAFALVST
ncbi:MAG: hypothetical protein ABSA91_07360 [Acidimicrobiales bacterium]|jgi:hypothetical protein